MRGSQPILAAFLRRDWALERSYRVGLALEIFASFAQLALFFYLGGLVDRTKFAASSDLGGGYFPFVVVGLALLTIVLTGVAAFARRIREDQTTGTLEALLVTPTPTSVLVLGSVAYDMLRAALSALAVIVLAVLLFDFRPTLGVPALVALVVGLPAFVALFAALGVLLGAFTVIFKETTGALVTLNTALSLLGGVYYPVNVLPGALEQVADLLPFTWGLDLVRAAVLRDEMEAGLLVLLVGFSAVALPLSLRLFQLAVAHAKKSGTLAQY